jgi:DNA-binding GntR family transcriptional regulator
VTQDKFSNKQDQGEGPLRRDSLQQQIYDRLRQGLVSGAYRPGEALSSRVLAELLGVSAMPVREALTRLTAEGALELTSSRTLRVRILTAEDFDELTAIRLSLEPMAAFRAAKQAGAAERKAADKCYTATCRAAESGVIDAYLTTNAEFHRAIYAAAGWPILSGAIERLWMIVGPSIRACVPDARHIGVSMQAHAAARVALHARDGIALARAITEDIQTAASDIRVYLEAAATKPDLQTGKSTQ